MGEEEGCEELGRRRVAGCGGRFWGSPWHALVA